MTNAEILLNTIKRNNSMSINDLQACENESHYIRDSLLYQENEESSTDRFDRMILLIINSDDKQIDPSSIYSKVKEIK